MFCPKGPAGIATNSNPASISLSVNANVFTPSGQVEMVLGEDF